ncbi:hypothetical protein A3860_08605 [Niastella vici]|uniref:Secretion system C-terminal sorting domain-containing protein n=1 Tax=Niastella vici TaxID=1703345 RepID=A0A1V9FH53_9BACT|nr:T9SS type A sorting domain-containing protein [Niastella vici]OQP57682.1 hypothetical protein A3860_08605 [Niastella vici]
MKKMYSFVMVSFIALTVHAQLVLNENFTGYTNGALKGQGRWGEENTGSQVVVNDARPLLYTTYSCGGQYITTDHVDGKDPYKPFSAKIQTTTSKTVFTSFVIRVNEVMSNIGFFYLVLRDTTALTPNIACRFFVQQEPGASKEIQFGIAVGIGNAAFTTTDARYNTGNTYLIVIRYDIVNDGPDKAFLWVNPSTVAEPAPGSKCTASFALSTTGEVPYGPQWNALQLFQSGMYTPAADLDAFRVAEGTTSSVAWDYLGIQTAALPGERTDFGLSPNPVLSKLKIEYPQVATDGHVQILNVQGMLMKDLWLPANTNASTIDMSSFASGLYFVLFHNGSTVVVKKVLKQ